MICLRCEREEFKLKPQAVIEQQYKGEMLKVATPAMECAACGWVTIGIEQVEELLRNTKLEYASRQYFRWLNEPTS